jgi:ATP-dependent RNA helicase DDX46/PRP5
VRELRAEMEGIKCRGKDVPKPIKTWAQAGLSNRVMELIRRGGFEKPMPIQCQARGSLRTSTRPTSNSLLVLRAYV